MALSIKDIRNIVENGRFEQLIGETESQVLDAKSQPYQFDGGAERKWELAKDISAFANSSGGYILIGFATERSSVQATEQISAVRPISKASFDPDRHLKLLSEWLYPSPKGIVARWVPYGDDSEKGIALLFVPQQDERLKPFLTTRTIGEKKSTTVLLGYVERRVDATEVKSVQEIQHALGIGLNLGRELLGRIEALESIIHRHFAIGEESKSEDDRKQRLADRIRKTLEHYAQAED